MEQSPSGKTYYKPQQQNEVSLLPNQSLSVYQFKLRRLCQTLSFKKALSHDSAESTPTHEHTVRRTWGHQATLEFVQARGQQGQNTANHTGIGTMMDVWLKEKNREQPYNNVASYRTKTVKSVRAEKAATEHQSSTFEDPEKGASTSSYWGTGSGYPSTSR